MIFSTMKDTTVKDEKVIDIVRNFFVHGHTPVYTDFVRVKREGFKTFLVFKTLSKNVKEFLQANNYMVDDSTYFGCVFITKL